MKLTFSRFEVLQFLLNGHPCFKYFSFSRHIALCKRKFLLCWGKEQYALYQQSREVSTPGIFWFPKRGELDSPYPGSEGCATHLFVVCCTGAISSPVDLSDARFHISDICFSGCLLQLHRVLLQPVLSLSKRVFRWRTEVADSLGEIAWHLVWPHIWMTDFFWERMLRAEAHTQILIWQLLNLDFRMNHENMYAPAQSIVFLGPALDYVQCLSVSEHAGHVYILPHYVPPAQICPFQAVLYTTGIDSFYNTCCPTQPFAHKIYSALGSNAETVMVYGEC